MSGVLGYRMWFDVMINLYLGNWEHTHAERLLIIGVFYTLLFSYNCKVWNFLDLQTLTKPLEGGLSCKFDFNFKCILRKVYYFSILLLCCRHRRRRKEFSLLLDGEFLWDSLPCLCVYDCVWLCVWVCICVEGRWEMGRRERERERDSLSYGSLWNVTQKKKIFFNKRSLPTEIEFSCLAFPFSGAKKSWYLHYLFP